MAIITYTEEELVHRSGLLERLARVNSRLNNYVKSISDMEEQHSELQSIAAFRLHRFPTDKFLIKLVEATVMNFNNTLDKIVSNVPA